MHNKSKEPQIYLPAPLCQTSCASQISQNGASRKMNWQPASEQNAVEGGQEKKKKKENK